MTEQTLRNRLKALRAEHDLTQEQLARKVGVSRKTVNVIEAGDYSPSVSLALAIAAVFGVPLDEVFWLE